MEISRVTVKEIRDSRGEPTIEVGVYDAEGEGGVTRVPQGKSKGSFEAVSVAPADAERILREQIAPALEGKEFGSVRALDEYLLSLDGTENKSVLGGNLMLGVSLSFARLVAKREQKELWETVRGEFFDGNEVDKLPMIFANFVNGGAHANNSLSFQEYLVVAQPHGVMRESVAELSFLYSALKDILAKRLNTDAVPLGDEAGFCAGFSKNIEPIFELERLIRERGWESYIKLGVDAAATGFFKDGAYRIDEKEYAPEQLLGYYQELYARSKLFFSIEDPFEEGDFKSFARLHKETDKLVVGDDLTVTNPKLIQKAIAQNAVSGVIIKPNQIGTLTETMEAVKLCKQHGLFTIFSHRSGETDDAFIIQLARAANADGVKIGPPARERIVKYDELLRLYS